MNNKISNVRKIKCACLRAVTLIAAAAVCMVLFGLTGIILYRGLPHISWQFLSLKPSLLKGTVGILPNILNTLYLTLFTLVVILPLGVGAAVYLNEYAKNRRVAALIEFATQTLAGLPSVVCGLVGMLVFVRFFKLGTCLVSGALTLTVITLPTVIRTTQESLKAVPCGLREGALALGAGKWRMLRTVLLPSAARGIVTGCILAAGRIIGESAALLFTAGTANEILSPSQALTKGSSGATLSVSLYMYAKERGDFETAYAAAVILLCLSLLINLTAKLIYEKGKKSA